MGERELERSLAVGTWVQVSFKWFAGFCCSVCLLVHIQNYLGHGEKIAGPLAAALLTGSGKYYVPIAVCLLLFAYAQDCQKRIRRKVEKERGIF